MTEELEEHARLGHLADDRCDLCAHPGPLPRHRCPSGKDHAYAERRVGRVSVASTRPVLPA